MIARAKVCCPPVSVVQLQLIIPPRRDSGSSAHLPPATAAPQPRNNWRELSTNHSPAPGPANQSEAACNRGEKQRTTDNRVYCVDVMCTIDNI